MIRKILRYVKGYVRIRIEGYSPERFLNICRNQKISVWNLASRDHSYELCLSIMGFRKLRPIAGKTNTRVRIIEKVGLPFLIFHYKKRKIFLVGVILAILLVRLYSLCIWDIHIEGNQKITSTNLVRFLESHNVRPLMQRKNVNCEQIEKEIREAYDDIVWVSVALDGARVSIAVKENDDTFQEDNTIVKSPSDIVAKESGKIIRMITRKGTPLVHPGDTVKKGEILVQGNVPVFNDEQEIIGYQYEHADAEIIAYVSLEYKNQISTSYIGKKYLKNKNRTIPFLRIGKTYFLPEIINYEQKQMELSEIEAQIKIGENFYLPIYYGYYEKKPYDIVTKQYTKMACQSILSSDFQYFCEELEKKGIQIMENSVKIHWYGNRASAEGTIFLNEDIAMTQDAQILDIERNTQNESSGTVD